MIFGRWLMTRLSSGFHLYYYYYLSKTGCFATAVELRSQWESQGKDYWNSQAPREGTT